MELSLRTLCALLGVSEKATADAVWLESLGISRGEIIEDVAEIKAAFDRGKVIA